MATVANSSSRTEQSTWARHSTCTAFRWCYTWRAPAARVNKCTTVTTSGAHNWHWPPHQCSRRPPLNGRIYDPRDLFWSRLLTEQSQRLILSWYFGISTSTFAATTTKGYGKVHPAPLLHPIKCYVLLFIVSSDENFCSFVNSGAGCRITKGKVEEDRGAVPAIVHHVAPWIILRWLGGGETLALTLFPNVPV